MLKFYNKTSLLMGMKEVVRFISLAIYTVPWWIQHRK